MANIEVKLRRGTDTEHSSFTGAEGEVTVDTTNDTLRVHDGSTAGGIRLAKFSEVGTLSDNSVTFTKMQDINTAKVIGRTTAGSGDPEEVSILDEDAMTSDSATALATQQSIKAYVDNNAGIPTGTVSAFAGAWSPTGWLLCGGQTIGDIGSGATSQNADYEDLFNLIKLYYGNAGTEVWANGDTVKLPDLRGRVVAGQDDMGGTSANRLTNQSGGLNGDTLGATGGAETHLLTSAESGLPAHNHSISIGHDGQGYAPPRDGASTGTTPYHTTQNNTAQNASSAHNNVQPTIILNYIIKY
jgi:microcystin-dependent protein